MILPDKLALALTIYALAATFGWGYFKGRNVR